MFVNPEFSKRCAKVIASKIDANLEEIDPLAYNWIENLREVGKKIARSLKR